MKYRPACQVALLAFVFVTPFVLSVTPAFSKVITSDKSFVEENLSPIIDTGSSYNSKLSSQFIIAEAPPPGAPVPGSSSVVSSPPQKSPETISNATPHPVVKNQKDSKPPPVKMNLSRAIVKQGGVVKLRIDGVKPDSSSTSKFVTFNSKKIPLFLDLSGDSLYCLIGVPVTIKPGTYGIAYGDRKKNLKVVSAKYPVRNLRLPKRKNNFKASPGEKETIRKAKKELSQKKLWSGKFKRPVKKGRISSVFGIRRRVNGKLLKDYFHSGTDFAAPRGTPIYSCANGKVIVAKTGWRLHGNTVCIDHGQGVISIYIHMNSVKVKKGQIVKVGERIGAVGSTGRASGPHLHFGIYVNDTATDPMMWFASSF